MKHRYHILGLNKYYLWRKYAKWYIQLMRSAEANNKGYTEKHHIFPVSIFG